MEVFLGFLAVLLLLAGGVGFVGFIEGRGQLSKSEQALTQAQEARQKAEEARQKAEEARDKIAQDAKVIEEDRQRVEAAVRGAESSSQKVKTIETQALQSIQTLLSLAPRGDVLERLSEGDPRVVDTEAGQVIGLEAASDLSDLSYLEDDDTRLLVLDSLGFAANLDPVKMAAGFTLLGQYWRVRRRFARSRARLERAIELNPTSADAHFHLARTLSHDTRGASTERYQAAWEALGRAEQLRGVNWEILAERAIVKAFLREYDGSVACLKQAREALSSNPDPRVSPLRVRNLTYNLACALCHAGRLEECLEELTKVVDQDQNWKAAAEDPSFESLRNSPLAGKFKRMLEEAARRGGA